MYDSASTKPQPRYESWDLNLSPREEARIAGEILPAIVARRARDRSKGFLLDEVGQDALRKAGLPGRGDNSLFLPTNARIFAPGAVDRAAQKRSMQQRDALVSGTGGYLVATENVSFVELLRNRMVAFAMGAQRLSGLVGNVTIPKQTVGATAYWLATETTAITEGNQTFAQLPLTPNTVGAYTQVSRLLQLQSSPDAQSIILRDLAAQVAIAADLAVIAGTGTEQPTGILNVGSTGTFTGTTLGTTALLDAQTDVASANGLTAACGYVTTPAVAALLQARQRFSGPTGDPLWMGNLLDGTVLGMKAMSSPQIPAATMIFGDFSQVVIGEWGVLELAVNPYDNFAQGLTGLRAMWTMDVGIKSTGSFSIATSIT